jgi:hypothetical protein
LPACSPAPTLVDSVKHLICFEDRGLVKARGQGLVARGQTVPRPKLNRLEFGQWLAAAVLVAASGCAGSPPGPPLTPRPETSGVRLWLRPVEVSWSDSGCAHLAKALFTSAEMDARQSLSKAGFVVLSDPGKAHDGAARVSVILSYCRESYNDGNAAISIEPGASAQGYWREGSTGMDEIVRQLRDAPQVLALGQERTRGSALSARPGATGAAPVQAGKVVSIEPPPLAAPDCASASPLVAVPSTVQFASHRDEEGPSYSDTLGWLAKSLAQVDTRHTADGVQTQYLTGVFGFDDCQIRLRTGFVIKAKAQCELVPVKFSDIDPAGVRVAKSGDLWTLTDSGQHVIWFQDRELAKRVAKAWSHAAELCGGRVDPF